MATRKKRTSKTEDRLAVARAACKEIRPGTSCQDEHGTYRDIVTSAIDEKTLRVLVVYRVRQTGQVLFIQNEDWGRIFSREPVGPDTSVWKHRPKVSGHFRHYKGGTYRVVATPLHQVTGRPYVVYKADADGSVWARQIEDWLAKVPDGDDRTVFRFTSIQ